jgi:uncharacterized protein (UPF0332 family)
VDGKLFLGTAQFLRNSGFDEAAYRSAVSRAYYACFLEARKIAFNNCSEEARRKDGIKNEKNIRHEPLQIYLKQSSIESIRQLGEDLAGLLGIRQEADYDMSSTITADDAQEAIENAEALLADFENIDSSAIGKAMEEYIFQIYSAH